MVNFVSHGGKTGTGDIGQYEALAQLNSGLHPYIDQNGECICDFPDLYQPHANSELKWERAASYNVGLDLLSLAASLAVVWKPI